MAKYLKMTDFSNNGLTDISSGRYFCREINDLCFDIQEDVRKKVRRKSRLRKALEIDYVPQGCEPKYFFDDTEYVVVYTENDGYKVIGYEKNGVSIPIVEIKKLLRRVSNDKKEVAKEIANLICSNENAILDGFPRLVGKNSDRIMPIVCDLCVYPACGANNKNLWISVFEHIGVGVSWAREKAIFSAQKIKTLQKLIEIPELYDEVYYRHKSDFMELLRKI